MTTPEGVELRSPRDADWAGVDLLTATSFGFWKPAETRAMWRTMVAPDGAVIACDGDDVVGTALFLDLRLTVPGGAVLPMAGVSLVTVAPTHRRRGVLSAMFGELHSRMTTYPIAGLEASEAGIYGRFGYGPATVVHRLAVDRERTSLRADVPDPGGVRVVRPGEHRAAIEDVHDRWRRRTPGGLVTPPQLWDEVFADRESGRGGGTALLGLLHPDGAVMYRMHSGERKDTAGVTMFCAVTPQAHTALWRVLLGLDLVQTVTVAATPGEVLPYLLTDFRAVRTTAIEDGLWVRLLDIPAALQARTYGGDVSAVLDVADPILGGGGRFRLDVRDGRAQCVPTEAPPDVSLDLAVLGSLYLGAHRASSFAAANRLGGNDSGLVRRLDAAFASDVPAQPSYGF
jgi:predicted acetyltransferase